MSLLKAIPFTKSGKEARRKARHFLQFKEKLGVKTEEQLLELLFSATEMIAWLDDRARKAEHENGILKGVVKQVKPQPAHD